MIPKKIFCCKVKVVGLQKYCGRKKHYSSFDHYQSISKSKMIKLVLRVNLIHSEQ